MLSYPRHHWWSGGIRVPPVIKLVVGWVVEQIFNFNWATFIASPTPQVYQAAFGRRFAGRAGTGKCSTR